MLNTGEVVISIPDDSKGNEKTSPFPSLLYVTDSGVVIGVLVISMIGIKFANWHSCSFISNPVDGLGPAASDFLLNSLICAFKFPIIPLTVSADITSS